MIVDEFFACMKILFVFYIICTTKIINELLFMNVYTFKIYRKVKNIHNTY